MHKNDELKYIFKKTISMAMPMVGSRVAATCSSFTSMLIMAQLGHAELAASALVNAIYFFVIVFVSFY